MTNLLNRRWTGGLLRMAIISVLAVVLFAGFACDDDENGDNGSGDTEPTVVETPDGDGATDGADAADVEAAVRDAIDAWNGADADGFLALVTDNLLQTEFEFASREEAAQALPEFIGEETITLGEFFGTEVSGTTATTTAPFFLGNMGAPEEFTLVQEGGQWLIDATLYVPGDVPEGATAVDLALSEYAFNFDADAIADGNIAFVTSNVGGDDHEVAIVTAPADLTLDDVIQQLAESEEDVPPGMEFVGAVAPLPVGSETTVQFQQPLEAGRYVMVCFLPDAEGTPHALLGMVSEFTIQ